jgi:hypothetical protein
MERLKRMRIKYKNPPGNLPWATWCGLRDLVALLAVCAPHTCRPHTADLATAVLGQTILAQQVKIAEG